MYLDMAESTEHAEAEVIKQFIPTLVVAVCDCVQNVSDKCLAKGLISESTSKRVLDPWGKTSEERARTLIHSVHTSTKSESSSFQIFLEVLDEELPHIVKEKVLSDMKKELADRAAVMCKAVIPVSQASRPVPLDQGLECIQQQSSFLGRYEDAVNKHASAATQKSLIEETLKSRSEESGRLRASLDMLSQSHDHERDEKQIITTRNRLSACETEMAELRERVEELESIIEEEGMRARRGRSTIRVGTKRLLEEFSRQNQEQFSTALKDKEQEHKRILLEKEAEIRQKMQEEMDLKMKDLEHKVALQEKELKIKELELKFAEVKKVESNPNQEANETHPTEVWTFGQKEAEQEGQPEQETGPTAPSSKDGQPEQETGPTAPSSKDGQPEQETGPTAPSSKDGQPEQETGPTAPSSKDGQPEQETGPTAPSSSRIQIGTTM